eukprot:gnl/MRDRNA2_/MRDRNA2_169877_c0_seq1.p1 gnl/MRDRNA2_/MRDRNA2_169877_c0~~gnl/MRDRNA2_/MRDRNA2_169877_c0_seq1.p1  ORF type:complete len:802 (+),score=147.42 gnl/MRDRNA2_/MRDRNA2_169877_c0_seq1:147-2408(+)
MIQAIVFGRIGLIIQRRTALNQAQAQRLDEIRQAMRLLQLPGEIQLRILSYYAYLQLHRNQRALSGLFENLSEQLKVEMKLYLYCDLVLRAPFLQQTPGYVLREIVVVMKDEVYLPGDWICRYGEDGTGMCFVVKGECSVLSQQMEYLRMLRTGAYFGEVSLLTGGQRTAFVRAERFCTLARMPKECFDPILEQYPEQLDLMVTIFWDSVKRWHRRLKKHPEMVQEGASTTVQLEVQRRMEEEGSEEGSDICGKQDSVQSLDCISSVHSSDFHDGPEDEIDRTQLQSVLGVTVGSCDDLVSDEGTSTAAPPSAEADPEVSPLPPPPMEHKFNKVASTSSQASKGIANRFNKVSSTTSNGAAKKMGSLANRFQLLRKGTLKKLEGGGGESQPKPVEPKPVEVTFGKQQTEPFAAWGRTQSQGAKPKRKAQLKSQRSLGFLKSDDADHAPASLDDPDAIPGGSQLPKKSAKPSRISFKTPEPASPVSPAGGNPWSPKAGQDIEQMITKRHEELKGKMDDRLNKIEDFLKKMEERLEDRIVECNQNIGFIAKKFEVNPGRSSLPMSGVGAPSKLRLRVDKALQRQRSRSREPEAPDNGSNSQKLSASRVGSSESLDGDQSSPRRRSQDLSRAASPAPVVMLVASESTAPAKADPLERPASSCFLMGGMPGFGPTGSDGGRNDENHAQEDMARRRSWAAPNSSSTSSNPVSPKLAGAGLGSNPREGSRRSLPMHSVFIPDNLPSNEDEGDEEDFFTL